MAANKPVLRSCLCCFVCVFRESDFIQGFLMMVWLLLIFFAIRFVTNSTVPTCGEISVIFTLLNHQNKQMPVASEGFIGEFPILPVGDDWQPGR